MKTRYRRFRRRTAMKTTLNPPSLPSSSPAQEHELPLSLISRFDKCFAAAWLDHDRAVLGTKDNSLVVVDVASKTKTCEVVRLPSRRAPPPPSSFPSRRREPPHARFPRRTAAADGYVGNILVRRDSDPRRHALMRVQTALARARSASAGDAGDDATLLVSDRAWFHDERFIRGDAPADDEDVFASADSRRANPVENCGVHAIAFNRTRTRLATGGADPRDAAVFSTSGSAFGTPLTPSALLVGHTDWVFGMDWIAENVLATGSRDSTVKIWSVPDASVSSSGSASTADSRFARTEIHEPIVTIRAHRERVRDVKYAWEASRLACVSTDGCVTFTDPSTMAVSETKNIPDANELTCLATDGKTLAAGSQAHVTAFDPRASAPVVHKKLPDGNRDGIRSVSFGKDGRLMTLGGGGGKLFFFNRAAGKFLPLVEARDEEEAFSSGTRKTRDGWHREDDEENPSSLETGPSPRAGVSSRARFPRDESSRRGALSLRLGDGYLDRENVSFLDGFSGADDWFGSRHACYAHAWDVTGTRLLVAGGPLAYGLKGCYVGVWR